MMGMGAHGMQARANRAGIGLKPERHIAGFSIRKEDGTALPLIFEAGVGKARDTVVLKLTGPVPAKASLWYGHGMDPYCNLVDGSDMAVPVFGPIALDEVTSPGGSPAAAAQPAAAPVKVLIITGDNVSAHNWQENSKARRGHSREGRPDQGRHHGDPREGPDRRKPGQVRCLAPQLQGNARRPARVALVGLQQGGVLEGRPRRQGGGRLSFRLECLHQAQLGRVREGGRRRLADPGVSRARTRLFRQEDRRQASDLRRAARRSSSTRSTSCIRTR